MNDLSNLIAKLLPLGVIASLLAVFYLLDVFSVRASFDHAPPKRVAVAEPSSPPVTPTPAPASRADFPPVSAPSNPPQEPSNEAEVANLPPPANVQSEREVSVPEDAASMLSEEELRSEQMAPRYEPPIANPQESLANGMNDGEAPVQLPNDEILQEESQQIEAETLQQMEQGEGVDSSGVVIEEQ